jgi:membrane-bound lytic murein transglycosylase B
LKILEQGDVPPAQMTGSWAGAMGHTQLMPTSYLAHAIDFDGDGRRDIWGSIPDALGSTASYLRHAGWRSDQAWGMEVVLPAGFDFGLAGPGKTLSEAQWRAAGVAVPSGRGWSSQIGQASLLLPAGRHGPAFLVSENFKVLLRYNNSLSYALAVGHLADRLRGGPVLATPWPTDDPPLAITERRELQERLSALGHHAGPIDGVIGDGTREALRAWQRQNGLTEDGWAGKRLLLRLRLASERVE